MRWRGGWSGILIDWVPSSSVARTAFGIGRLGGGGVYWTGPAAWTHSHPIMSRADVLTSFRHGYLSGWASLLCR